MNKVNIHRFRGNNFVDKEYKIILNDIEDNEVKFNMKYIYQLKDNIYQEYIMYMYANLYKKDNLR